jgi:hypothetical protein
VDFSLFLSYYFPDTVKSPENLCRASRQPLVGSIERLADEVMIHFSRKPRRRA